MIRMSVLSVLTKNSFTMTELRMSEKAANVQRTFRKSGSGNVKKQRVTQTFSILYIVICLEILPPKRPTKYKGFL